MFDSIIAKLKLYSLDRLSDARGGKNPGTGKDNGTNQGTAKGVPPLPDLQETKTGEKSSVTR